MAILDVLVTMDGNLAEIICMEPMPSLAGSFKQLTFLGRLQVLPTSLSSVDGLERAWASTNLKHVALQYQNLFQCTIIRRER